MTTSSRRHLRGLEGSLRQLPEPRCSVAAQAVMAGPQSVRVTGTTPHASGRGYGHLCLRVGRVLIYLEDWDALLAWRAASTKPSARPTRPSGPNYRRRPTAPSGSDGCWGLRASGAPSSTA